MQAKECKQRFDAGSNWQRHRAGLRHASPLIQSFLPRPTWNAAWWCSRSGCAGRRSSRSSRARSWWWEKRENGRRAERGARDGEHRYEWLASKAWQRLSRPASLQARSHSRLPMPTQGPAHAPSSHLHLRIPLVGHLALQRALASHAVDAPGGQVLVRALRLALALPLARAPAVCSTWGVKGAGRQAARDGGACWGKDQQANRSVVRKALE